MKYTTVPDVSGKNIDEASSLISNAGLRVSKAVVDTTDKSQDGKVANQSISASEQVKQGTTVTLSYYKYKEPEVKPETPKNEGDNQQQPGGTNTGQPNGGNQQGGSTGQNNGGVAVVVPLEVLEIAELLVVDSNNKVETIVNHLKTIQAALPIKKIHKNIY